MLTGPIHSCRTPTADGGGLNICTPALNEADVSPVLLFLSNTLHCLEQEFCSGLQDGSKGTNSDHDCLTMVMQSLPMAISSKKNNVMAFSSNCIQADLPILVVVQENYSKFNSKQISWTIYNCAIDNTAIFIDQPSCLIQKQREHQNQEDRKLEHSSQFMRTCTTGMQLVVYLASRRDRG